MTSIGPYNLPTLMPIGCPPAFVGTMIPSNTVMSEVMIRFPGWFESLKPYVARIGQKVTLFLIPTDHPTDIIVHDQLDPNTLAQSPLIILTASSGKQLIIRANHYGHLSVNGYPITGSSCATDGMIYW